MSLFPLIQSSHMLLFFFLPPKNKTTKCTFSNGPAPGLWNIFKNIMMDDLLPSCNRRVISRPISHANSIFTGHFVLYCNCSAEMKWTEKSPLNNHGLGSTIAHWTQRANYPFGSVKVLDTAKWKCKQHMLGSVISPEGSLQERVDWIHVYGQIFFSSSGC